MLPVALTSPLWWVARWSSRLLTGLAVAVAFSLGGPTVPEDVALPAPVDPAAPVLAGLPLPAPPVISAACVVTVPLGAPSAALPGGDTPTTGCLLTGPDAAPLDAVAPIDPAGRPGRPVAAPPSTRSGLSPGGTGPRAPPVG